MRKYKLDKSAQVIENSNYIMTQEEVCERLNDLQSQLAEKEKENELMAKTLKMTKFVEKEVNQDKISFAIAELEKVKETTECVLDSAIKNSSLNQSYYDRLLDEIDNQIKQLKEIK